MRMSIPRLVVPDSNATPATRVRYLPVVGLLLLAACGTATEGGVRTLHGVALPHPIPRPSFVLRDTRGERYDFRARTAGQLTLFFFGYTHCPDVCPVHLANIEAGLERLPYTDRQRIRVVFVTTDPARDTPTVIRQWLDAFDPAFIGLSGTEAEVDTLQTRLGLGAAIRSPATAGGSYTVGHATQVFAFEADDSARVVYPFGTRQADWVHDLPLLLHRPLSR